MTGLRTILMSGVAAMSLAASPALSQASLSPQTETPETGVAGSDQTTQADALSYDDAYGERFAEWGDRNVDELVGTTVINDAGETIGEIDNFALAEGDLVAIVGVGGFLGMGEHDVAVPIDQFTTEGDQLVLAGVTREQLETMPEFDRAATETFAADQSLRTGYETPPGMVPGAPTDTAGLPPADTPEAEAAEEATEMAEAESAEEAAEPMADAGAEMAADTPDPAMTDQAAEGAEMAEAPAADAPMAAETETAEADSGWTDEMDTIFADIADREIAELIGMDVAGADGEVVGEIDNFALEGQDVVAIVGVGGFLGIGEHDVALSLGEMTFDGEKLVLSSITEDQLREMPEYDGDVANALPQDGTLRSTYNQ